MVYEIARYDSENEGERPSEKMQLLSADGVLLLRDAAGSEKPCEGDDIASVIASTPSLREIRAAETIHISCSPEIAAQLPLVLEAVLDGEDAGGCCAEVNGADWIAFPTLDGEHVMLPGLDEFEGPDMSPRWAELTVEEGEWNPLIGFTSIGVVTPGVAVEFGRCDPGGLGGECAVALKPVDEFATVFVAWLLNPKVLNAVWYGDSEPSAPTVQLFAEAAAAVNHRANWHSEMEDEGDDSSNWASASLEIHLSEELIDVVRVRLSSRDRDMPA